MNTTELDRIKVIERVVERQLAAVDAAEQLGLTPRHIGRLVRAYRASGPRGLMSRQRGKRSNRAYSETFKQQVLHIVGDSYADFGPTLAAEKLGERHDIHVSSETLRRWLSDVGAWENRRTHRKHAYQPRYRRDCFGELIQIDGSHHAWFEDRGPKCCLLVFIDDATSNLVELRFCPSETTMDYMHSTKRYIERYGKPVAFYSGKHTVFRVSRRDAKTGTGLTQFGRGLHDLNIDIIYAHSCEAKGRVERMNQTLQDRLVKELRLEGINTIHEGNEFLPEYMGVLNRKFGKEALNPTDLHRPHTDMDNLEDAMCWQEQRTVSNSLTVQYDRVVYLLEPGELTNELRRKRVTFFDFPDGSIDIRHEGVSLPYSTFDKIGKVKQADIVDNKRLGAVLAMPGNNRRNRVCNAARKLPNGAGNSRYTNKRNVRQTQLFYRLEST